jgi:polysaccharide pyruvyl transferase WcaK-like protein
MTVSWKEDPFWTAAASACEAALEEAEWVLVPTEFLDLHARFAPLEFSYGIDAQAHRLAYCCAKTDADRIDPTLLGEDESCYRWANEVFVLGANFKWRAPDRPALRQHLRFWQLMLDRRRRGAPTRDPAWRPAAGNPAPEVVGPKVIVIGASGMGNVGDDLIAQVIAQALQRDADVHVWLSDSALDPIDLRRFDGVVVGGGGLVYASRDGGKEWQNLANYLRFGPIGRAMDMPVAMIGVSDQDHAHVIEQNPFVRGFAQACLPAFSPVSTRDPDSATLLSALGARQVTQGCDLLFGWLDRVRGRRSGRYRPAARVAMGGELLAAPVFEWLSAQPEMIGAELKGHVFDFVLMSDDDVEHGRRTQQRFAGAGLQVEIADLRGLPFNAIIKRMRGWRGLVTTRFHGLVLAAMAGLPVLAVDGAEGKKSRLLRQLEADGKNLLLASDASSLALLRLQHALKGDMHIVPHERLELHAQQFQVHEQALQILMSEVRLRTSRPPRAATALQAALASLRRPRKVRDVLDQRSLHDRLTVGGEVGLCWAASSRDTDGFANLGDALSAVIVCALAGRAVRHVDFNENRTKLVAVGSIGHAIVGGEAVLWGTGVSIRGGVLVRNIPRTRYDIRALRGRISAGHFSNFGVEVPAVFGDPVWFLPSIFGEPVEKKWELGVIPHIQDVDGFGPDARPPAESVRYRVSPTEAGSIKIINTWHEPTWEGMKKTLREILACKRIASQSFHGVVIAEAYRIPVLNFRQLGGTRKGLVRLRLDRPCVTDPRIHEFYGAGAGRRFSMYAQRRDELTDWDAVLKCIDRAWEPLQFDAAPLMDAFPLPLAFNPLSTKLADLRRVAALAF